MREKGKEKAILVIDKTDPHRKKKNKKSVFSKYINRKRKETQNFICRQAFQLSFTTLYNILSTTAERVFFKE